jgi:RHS repeat-associated protein
LTTYSGFELNALDTARSVTQKTFTDAVPDKTAPGRVGTTFLDGYGRTFKTETQLGSDYQNQKLVVQSSYDSLGRPMFKSDPFVSTGSFETAYGTTYTYNTDGTPNCFVRGPGVQPASAGVNETSEVYPICYNRFFANRQEIQDRQDSDSLLAGSNQSGVIGRTILGATNRVLERATVRFGTGTKIDDVVFSYDALGNRTSMKRYQDATNQAGPVTTIWHFNSLGQMTKLEEDGVAARTRKYDFWGNLTVEQWCNDMTSAPCPSADRRSTARYDARNRVTHREDQSDSSGQPVSGTAMDYSYDANGGNMGFLSNNMLGRLASATWPTGQVWLTYDAFGRVNSRAFVDTSVASNDHHYEVHDTHDDGSEKTLHLRLHDTNANVDEQVNYAYDSAGRVNSVIYNDGGTSQSLFSASGDSPIYDVFGHLTAAKYGPAQFNATYANTGRRFMTDAKVMSGDGLHSREIAFPTLNGITPYDPVGRERQRQEFTDGAGPTALLRSYDPIGQLSAAQNLVVATNTVQPDRAFTYDQLGNILIQADSSGGSLGNGPGRVFLTYSAPDRLCGLAFGGALPAPACNVSYDGAGNITSMRTNANSVPGTSGIRTLEYFPNGAVKSIADGGSNANFAYDAFGGLQQLTVYTPQADTRYDKHFGTFIKARTEGAAAVLTRNIPAGGVVATKHGPAGGWTFAFSETTRGTRYVVDGSGAFVQNVDYQPYGEVKNPSGATPRTTNYVSEQFNGGDNLAAFGVVNLGARLYDAVIGRFLSPDPLLIPRTAARTNPYSFAHNDPINKVDPSGMDSDKRDPGNVNTSSNNDHFEPGFEADCSNTYGFCGEDPPPGGSSRFVKDGHFFLDGHYYYTEAEMVAARESGADGGTYETLDEQNALSISTIVTEPSGREGLLGPLENLPIPNPVTAGIRIADKLTDCFPSGSKCFSAFAPQPGDRPISGPGGPPDGGSPKLKPLKEPPNGGEGLSSTKLGKHYVDQVKNIIPTLPLAQRADALRQYVRRVIPDAMAGHNEHWKANPVPGQPGIWFGVKPTRDGFPAMGVHPETCQFFCGVATMEDLLQKGFNAPGLNSMGP